MRYLVVLYVLVASTFAKNLPPFNKVTIKSNVNSRIHGGENATLGEYPHMVSFRDFSGNSTFHLCGGAIVHEEWVITAASCIIKNDPLYHKVVVGSIKLGSGDVYELLEIHVHELFDIYTMKNDVAILKVKKIKFSENVNKIRLEKGFVGGNLSVDFSGWIKGYTVGDDPENTLQHLTLNTISIEKCRNRMHQIPIENSHICTLRRPGVGGCTGDAGGPLIRSVNGVNYLVGIMTPSWWYGPDCLSLYHPDTFARVSWYVSWFNSKCNCNL